MRIEPLTYKWQVVAGKNYYIKALLQGPNEDKSHVHLKIYQPIRGRPEILGHLDGETRESAIKFF